MLLNLKFKKDLSLRAKPLKLVILDILQRISIRKKEKDRKIEIER